MKTNRIHRVLSGLIAVLLTLCLALPAYAAEIPSQQEIAAASLRAQGIMCGDSNGNMNLESSLTRAELAVLLSRISINQEHIAYEKEFYTKMCTINFSDVPAWAQVHVGVCAANSLMGGYGNGKFGPSDPVTPQMACTVILRYLERDGWTYDTACQKAQELGLAPAEALAGSTITRGNMAILLYQALGYMAWLQTL